MKLQFILPFYLLLASATFCTRNISEDKRPTTLINKDVAAVTTPSHLTGTLELDTLTNTIYADLWLQVSSYNFKYAHNFMPLESPNRFKGIAFRYYDTVNNAPDNGKDTAKIHVVFNFINDYNWKVNDSVRIMSLDEDSQTVFQGLKPYFIDRMETFKNSPTTYPELLAFNNKWNQNHPSNSVTTANVSNTEDKKTEGNKKHQKFIPRLTKDDGVLSLTLKR